WLLALPTVKSTPVTARARAWFGQIALMQGDDSAAEAALQEALLQHTAHNDRDGVALALLILGIKCVVQGDMLRANALLTVARRYMRHTAHVCELRATWQSAVVAVELGDIERAMTLVQEAEHTQRDSKTESAVKLYLNALIAAAGANSALAEG